MAPRSRLPAAVEQERRQIAQTLHNTVCQELTGVCFLAGAAAHKHGGADTEIGKKFAEIADLVQQAGAHLAEIVHELSRPAAPAASKPTGRDEGPRRP